MIRIRSITVAAFAGALLMTSTAWAVDGVVLIDQNRALAGNVTPGDTPGFPITISQPGSYRLSGNLSVPDEVDGIKITADNVTLDLNGFAIAGAGTHANTGISDSTGRALATDALPLTPPSLSLFDSATFSLSGVYGGNQIEIDGNINSLTEPTASASAVEPGTLALFSLGVLSLGWFRRGSRSGRKAVQTAASLMGCCVVLACACAPAIAQDFKPYPGSKLDEKISREASAVVAGTQSQVYTTGESFEKVYAFPKGLYKEHPWRLSPPKLASGKQVQWAFFILDEGKDLAHSKYWMKIQRPYIGTVDDHASADFKDI